MAGLETCIIYVIISLYLLLEVRPHLLLPHSSNTRSAPTQISQTSTKSVSETEVLLSSKRYKQLFSVSISHLLARAHTIVLMKFCQNDDYVHQFDIPRTGVPGRGP